MANFNVGQRVRLVRNAGSYRLRLEYVNREGAFVRYRATALFDCTVRFDGDDCDMNCFSESLVPLSDPKADEFIERIKSMKPYEEPVREREPDYAAMLREFVRKA